MRKQPYLAFLLRLWPGRPGDSAGWHASLEEPETHRVLGFDSLDLLFAYLSAAVAAAGPGAGQDPGEGAAGTSPTRDGTGGRPA